MTSVHFAQPDVTLRLDLAGVIRHAALSDAIGDEAIEGWVGRPWAETVAVGGDAHVARMLHDARSSGVSSFHQVRQVFPSGLELAVEYTTVRLGGESGLIAIGRSLEAVSDLRARLLEDQSAMERDAWRLRQVETRYRLLFETSMQPVMFVDAEDGRILEANPAAIEVLGSVTPPSAVLELPADQREAFAAMLARARSQGTAPGMVVQLGPERESWLVRASLVAAEDSPMFALQLSPSLPRIERAEAVAPRLRLEDVVERLREGFVVLDGAGMIRFANRAFLDLLELPAPADAHVLIGRDLGRWLARDGADAVAVLDRARREGSFAGFTTTLTTARGTSVEIELSAAGSSETSPQFVGVLVRRRPDPRAAKQVGKQMLRELVLEAVAAVEMSAGEAAAEIAKAERAAAANRPRRQRDVRAVEIDRRAADLIDDDRGRDGRDD